jgi:hypothetical protein
MEPDSCVVELVEVKIESHTPEAVRSSGNRHSVAPGREPSLARRLSRQPLVHFLIAGLVLFGATSFFERSSNSNSAAIHVSAAEIQRLEDVWSRQYGRTPTSTELGNLVDDYIREEVYYREAVASGLDKDDSIIRRRLVEKMEFLSQEIASGEPSEKKLQDYFERNRDKFQLPPQLAFSHIFFSPSKRGVALQSDAIKALALLRSPKSTGSEATQLGDAFMLQSEYPLQTPEAIKALFGTDFGNDLFRLRPGTWQGPLRSSYGLHLVRITQYQSAHTPTLSEVRTQVVTDLKNDRLQAATERYYARLRQRYRVQIDNAAIAAAAANGNTRARVKAQAEQFAPDVD